MRSASPPVKVVFPPSLPPRDLLQSAFHGGAAVASGELLCPSRELPSPDFQAESASLSSPSLPRRHPRRVPEEEDAPDIRRQKAVRHYLQGDARINEEVVVSANQLVKFFGCDNLNVVVSALFDLVWKILLLACDDMQIGGATASAFKEQYVKLLNQFRDSRKEWLEEISRLRDLKRAETMDPNLLKAVDQVMKTDVFHFVPENAIAEEDRPYFKDALEECLKMALMKATDIDSEQTRILNEELAAAKAALAECQEELENLRNIDTFGDLEHARGERKRLEKKLSDAQKHAADLARKNALYLKKLQQLGLSDEEIEDADMDVEAIRFRMQDPHVVSEIQHLKQLLQEKSQEVEELQNALQESMSRSQVSTDQVEPIRANSKEMADLDKQLALAKRKAERLEASNKELLEKLDGALGGNAKSEVHLKARLKEAHDEIEQLKAQLMEQGGEEALKRFEEEKQRQMEAEQRLAQLEQELAERPTASDFDELKQKYHMLDLELEASRLAEQRLNDQVNQSLLELSAQQSEMEKLRSSADMLADLRRQVEESTQRSALEEEELQEERRRFARLQQEHEQLKTSLQGGQCQRCKDCEERLAEALAKLAEKDRELLELRDQTKQATTFGGGKVFKRLWGDAEDREDRREKRASMFGLEPPREEPLVNMPGAPSRALGESASTRRKRSVSHRRGAVDEPDRQMGVKLALAVATVHGGHGASAERGGSAARSHSPDTLEGASSSLVEGVPPSTSIPHPAYPGVQYASPPRTVRASSPMRRPATGEMQREVHFEMNPNGMPNSSGTAVGDAVTSYPSDERQRIPTLSKGLEDSILFQDYCRRLATSASAPVLSSCIGKVATKPFQLRHLVMDAQMGRPCGKACIPMQKVQSVLGRRLPDIDGPDACNVDDSSTRGTAPQTAVSKLGSHASYGPVAVRPSSAAAKDSALAEVAAARRPLSGLGSGRKGAAPGRDFQHLPQQSSQPLLRRRPASGQ